MPAGQQLIEAVAAELKADIGQHPWQIELALLPTRGKVSRRVVRYAITELLKSGRALRIGSRGLVYAAPEIK